MHSDLSLSVFFIGSVEPKST